MKIKIFSFRKLISLFLCFSIMLTLITGLVYKNEAAEAVSLPHIEEIKKNHETFRILEIVPDKNQGSIGYYIPGSEPWINMAAKKPSKNDRITFVNDTLVNHLNRSSKDDKNPQKNYSIELCNLKGQNSESYPLNFVGNYEEVYPWNKHEGFFEMQLDHEEIATNVLGSFVPQTNGEYIDNNKYTFVSDGSGDYVQLIDGFCNTEESGEYYYNVSFTKISYSTNPNIPKWALIYKLADANDVPDLTATINGEVTNLCIVGVVGTSDFPGLYQGQTYYMASWGAPSTTYNSNTAPYRAVSSGFRKAEAGETGYFYRTTNNFKYVGTGGLFNFNESGKDYHNISYSTVYYKGGFINNNWFLKNVFDWQDGESYPEIEVNTTSPIDVTAEMVNSANLIVINYGFNIEGNTYDGIYRIDFSKDLSSSILSEILQKCANSSQNKKVPVIFDYNLKNSAQLNIKTLVSQLISTANASSDVLSVSKEYDSDKDKTRIITYVSENQYCINSSLYIKKETNASGSNVDVYNFGLPLACRAFNDNTQIFGDPTKKVNPFYPIYEDIYYENFLREIRGAASQTGYNKLDQNQITMASCIRYIINSSNRRKIENKAVVKVLNIEPRSGKMSAKQKEILAGWLGIREADLVVITMSAAEFVGKIDDPRKEYDLIFLGDNLDGFETVGGKTSYNDKNMDGLIYSNIGDKVMSGFGGGNKFGLSGLLERDYRNNSSLVNHDNTHTFRYSGNDITREASKKLEDFAKSGYPIIVGDKLICNRLEKSGNSTSGLAYVGSSYIFDFFSRCYYSPNTSLTDEKNLMLKVKIDRYILFGILYFGGRIKTADCTLYKNNQIVTSKNISNSNTVTFDLGEGEYNNGDVFYCDITVKSSSDLFGSTYNNLTNNPKGRTETFTLYKGADPAYVDVNSNMHSLLNSICTKKNVKSWSAILESDLNKSLLAKFVNLPKPSIVFSTNSDGSYVKYPVIYSKENGEMNSLSRIDGVNRLEYVFKIQNNADPFPQDSRYTCKLYVDMDGNGSFSEDERVSDVGIREWKNGSQGSRITNGELVSNKEYYLFYELPSSKIGFVPWKLVITDNIYMSYDHEINYTRVEPLFGEPQPTIEILQINSDNLSGINLQRQTEEASTGAYYSSVTGKYYYGIIGKLLADISKDFKVNITTISASDANDISKDKPLSHTITDSDGNATTTHYINLTDYINSFNMLVLGFGDSYRELNLNTTKSISAYINDNKPVLMTHDVTSYYSLPNANFRIGSGNTMVYNSNTIPNGYNVNMLLRGKIGMDRYGVVDSKHGFTSFTSSDVSGKKITGSVANSYIGANLNEIKKAGYDIAYQPKSQNATVPETQGLTNGTLARFLVSGKMPFSGAKFSTNDSTDKAGYTNTITQVNKGQITTYPYNVNTELFNGKGPNNSKTIATTHFQYYQLNMNAKDMIVWYCLADDTTGSYPNSNIYAQNDVINSYYIYTCGNVTYSGMGHSEDISEEEAKLFVNTLIASFRSSVVSPTVNFSNKDGTKKGVDSHFVPCDENDLIIIDPKAADDSRRIYFTVNDSNIIQTKIITAEFYFGGSKIENLSIYDAETNNQVTSFTSTYTYYVKLDDVLKTLNLKSIPDGGLSLSVHVTTKLPSGNEKTGSATITIRKLTLFQLR